MATISINSSEVFTVTRVNDGKSYSSCRIDYRWEGTTTWNTFATLSNTSTVTYYTYTPTAAQKIYSSAYYRAIFINVGGVINNHDISAEIYYAFPKTLPLAPYRAPIDCSAYFGGSIDNVPIVHLAQQGTALSVLKSSSPTASSYFHSNQLPVCASSMHEITLVNRGAVLTESLARYLDTVVFLCMVHERREDKWYALNMLFPTNFVQTATFGSMYFENATGTQNSNEWVKGQTRTIRVANLPGFYSLDKIRIYPINISIDARYINYVDFSSPSHPSGVLISKEGLYVNKLKLDSLMPMASVSSSMILPNYNDQVYPTGGSVQAQNGYRPAYTGPASNSLQLLGSSTFGSTPTWNIEPNKGIIKKNDLIWWDAAFGRTRTGLNPYTAKQVIRGMLPSYAWVYPVALGTTYTTSSVNDNYAVLPSQLNYTTESTYGACSFIKSVRPGWEAIDANVVSMFTQGMVVRVARHRHRQEKTEQYYEGTNTSPYTRVLWSIDISVYHELYLATDNSLRVRTITDYSTFRYTQRSDDYPTVVYPPLENAEFSVFQIY